MGAKFGKNQGLWSQNGDTMSPGLCGVFQLVKKVALRVFRHSPTASVCGSFARHTPGVSHVQLSQDSLILMAHGDSDE